MSRQITSTGHSLMMAGLLLLSVSGVAEEFRQEFESPEVAWQVRFLSREAEIAIHERRRGVGRSGSAEFIRVISKRENSRIRLESSVPAATVFDELEASVWVKSTHEGFAFAVRVTLPEVMDPETNSALTLLIMGDRYQQAGRWQQLKCRTTDRSISDQLRLQRSLKQLKILSPAMFVDQVIIEGQLPPESVQIQFDDLLVTPVVPFRASESKGKPEFIQQVRQTVEEPVSPDHRKAPSVRFSLHRLQVESQPFFPRIITHQQERPDVLASAGLNVVWVPDYENTSVTGPIRRQGLWITSAPPYAKGADGEPLESEDASLLPFGSNTSPVLFWMLGARMTLNGHPRLSSWTNQIREADRLNKRPIAADVIENERLASRHVDMLGISRHVIHSHCSLADYRDWMIQRREQSWPDTFCWTWIQTEPVSSMADLARGIESRPQLEPEQLRLQVYAALAAGCRGLGFWTTTSLSEETPAARERLLTLTLLNLELELFEPWITSGGKPELVPFHLEASRPDPWALNGKNRSSDAGKLEKASNGKQPNGKSPVTKPSREMQAALLSSDRGALLLPMWLEENSQFVPGPLTARNLTITVPGGGETAAAWEITTTGRLRHLDREPAAGGVKIKLPRLDQTAAILITSDPTLVEELNQKIASIQDRSAHLIVELARLKLDRTRQIDQELQNLGVGRPEAWRWLGEAKQQLEKGDSALKLQQYAIARQHADESLLYSRFLQRAHWDYANQRRSSATSSPWNISFQSLPEHWKLVHRLEKLGDLDAMENLLPSGEFEDLGTLVAEHWQHEQAMQDTVESMAGLLPSTKQGKLCLRLSAVPIAGTSALIAVSTAPVTVVSPGVTVQTGQVVRITGWAKVPTTISGSVDGALIYDSLLGKSGAVRLRLPQDWQRFELVRPIPESQELTVSLSLQGLGELWIDDLKVTAFEPGPETAPLSPMKSAIEPARFSPLDMRRLNPLQRRKP